MALPREAYGDLVPVPRAGLELPLALPVPIGFDPARLESWPVVEGRLEYVEGRLLYMPPTGDRQQDTCADVVGILSAWRRTQPDFVVGGNEAGMLLGGEVRAADAAVWRRADLGDYDGGLRRVPPVLAVEVAGKYDAEGQLRAKAQWYLRHGVHAVWLLFPVERRAVVITTGAESDLAGDQRLPAHDALPGLVPAVGELFEQVSR